MNTSNFISELVEMAKAVERVPQLEAELTKAHDDCDTALRSLQSRELSIIEYKRQIEELTAKTLALEVARDDAELNFLEGEERLEKLERSFQTALEAMDATDRLIQSFKAKPEAVPTTPSRPEPAIPSNEQATASQGRSEHPLSASEGQSGQHMPSSFETLATMPSTSPEHTEGPLLPSTSQNGTVSTDTKSSPNFDPYSGLPYHDYPGFLSRSEWLAGGGTEADYDWRPEPRSGSF